MITVLCVKKVLKTVFSNKKNPSNKIRVNTLKAICLIGEKKGQWQWQDKDGRWRDHGGETSDKIEHVYQTRHGKGTVVVECENEK